MRYRNRRTGVIVSPVTQIAEETFKRSAIWEPFFPPVEPVHPKPPGVSPDTSQTEPGVSPDISGSKLEAEGKTRQRRKGNGSGSRKK